jgi:hypothetical protein
MTASRSLLLRSAWQNERTLPEEGALPKKVKEESEW